MNFIKQNIYYFLFVILIFEGPVTSFVGGNYAALGELNLTLFFIIALAGDVVGDLGIYFLGRFFNKSKLVNKLSFLSKAKKYIIERKTLEKFLSKYDFLYFLIVKITPYLSGTGLFIAGVKKYNFGKYVFFSTIFSFIVKAVYIGLGYLGSISLTKLQVIHEGWCNFILFLILGIIIFYTAKSLSKEFVIRLKGKFKDNNNIK